MGAAFQVRTRGRGTRRTGRCARPRMETVGNGSQPCTIRRSTLCPVGMPTGCSNPGAFGASDPRRVLAGATPPFARDVQLQALITIRATSTAGHCFRLPFSPIMCGCAYAAPQPSAPPTSSSRSRAIPLANYAPRSPRFALCRRSGSVRKLPVHAGKVSSSTIRAYIETQKGRVAMRKTFQYRLYP